MKSTVRIVLTLAAVAFVRGDDEETVCQRDEMRCPKEANCVKTYHFCDGKNDCDSGIDEFDCHGRNPSRAPKCRPEDCHLPFCFCSADGTTIPGGLTREQTPQMVMVTFDDAVHGQIDEEIIRILDQSILSPNNCTLKGTFFVSHANTDYSMVNVRSI